MILAKPNEPTVQFHYFKYQSVHVGDTGCTPAFVTSLISGADITQGAFSFSHFSPLKIFGVKCAFQPNEPKPLVTSMPFFRELVPKGHVQRKKTPQCVSRGRKSARLSKGKREGLLCLRSQGNEEGK